MHNRSPFRKPSPARNPESGGGGGPRPTFSVAPTLTGTTLVGDTLTLTFTPVGVGAMTCSVQFFGSGSVVNTQTPVIATGVSEVVTYVTAAAGPHAARVTIVDTNDSSIAASNTIIITNTQGPFSSAFDASFATVT